MSERYAVTNGIWEAATFNGGTLPQAGDTVHANGYAVTVDQSITVTALSTRAGATASAGGSFTAVAGVTITADVYAGTSNCLSYNAASGLLTIIGTVYGSDTTGSAYGLNHNAGGDVILTGNSRAGSVTSSIATTVTGTGNMTVYGKLYGGSASGGSSHGLRWVGSGTGVCRIYGHCYGATSGSNSGGFAGAASSALAFIYGNCYGDVGPGLTMSTAGDVYVFGDVIGGTAYNCGGAWITGSSTGNCYVYGTARSSPTGVGPGAYSNSSGSACIVVNSAEIGVGGGWPTYGKVVFADLSNVTFGARNLAGTLRTLGVTPRNAFKQKRFGII